MKKILKNPRILLLLLFVVLSIIFIGPNPNPTGVKINYIGKNASFTGLMAGDIIYSINGEAANTELMEKDYYGNVKLETSRGVKYAEVNGSLGVSTEATPMSNLVFGLDIKGGVRTLIEPNLSDNVSLDSIISTLQTRINIYGLRESNFRPIWYERRGFIEITMAGGTEEELRDLLEHEGKFEAMIPVILRVEAGETNLNLDKEYKITVENDMIKTEGVNAGVGEEFTLAGIPFYVENITDTTINLTSTVYDESDILIVYFGSSRTEQVSGGYSWSFPIEISGDGAQKFAWITQNVPLSATKPGETYRYLESRLYLYLDGDLLDELNIRSSLKGKVVTEISIEGWAKTLEQAKNARIRLQSILKSGALPTSIEIVKMDAVSPKLGLGFLGVAVTAAGIAILAVGFIILIRYRRPKVIIPTITISLSEVLIILGFASLIQWTIDLAAIAGIIAAVGTGVDSQIIMLDQALRGETKSWTLKERISRAFFIIFGAGGTTIAAMFPMMILGFGLLRGFAITTTIGVLSGILITRPAFGVIVEKMLGDRI